MNSAWSKWDNTWRWVTLLLLIAVFAGWYRYQGIMKRPMHADEAVHALKLGDFLKGEYHYDPHDYHGPTLYYFTLPVLSAEGVSTVAGMTETQLRIVPLIFGVAMIPLLWLLRDALGKTGMFVAGVLISLSPAMVFYSTYYIQEELFIFFTLATVACAWRYKRDKKFGWAVGASVCFALTAATKETWIISAVAAGVGLLAVWFRWRLGHLASTNPWHAVKAIGFKRIAILFAVAFFVWASVLSVGFTKPYGIIDGFRTFLAYVDRNAKTVEHHQPWDYYLKVLAWWQPDGKLVWNEGLVVALGLIGLFAGFTGWGIKPERRNFALFVAVFSVVVITVYSAVSYKTPWCVLTFLVALILLGGIAIEALAKPIFSIGEVLIVHLTELKKWVNESTRLNSVASIIFFALAWCMALIFVMIAAAFFWTFGNLENQAWWASRRQATNRTNPYVYSGSLLANNDLQKYLEKLCAAEPHTRIVSRVTRPAWPLPWYLRRVPAMYSSGSTGQPWMGKLFCGLPNATLQVSWSFAETLRKPKDFTYRVLLVDPGARVPFFVEQRYKSSYSGLRNFLSVRVLTPPKVYGAFVEASKR